MRVRRFELRLIAIALVAAWALAAGLVLLAYRPGGPFDLFVGLVMVAPIAIALAGAVWPPLARGGWAFPAMVGLGLGSLLVLLPSIGGVLNQLLASGSQTLMPSPEAAYPWLLALFGTSLFSGFGVSRRLAGGAALRRRRFIGGLAIATLVTVLCGGLFAGVAIANEIALRDLVAPPGSSRFGSTSTDGDPPACDAPLTAGPAARLSVRLSADIDLRPIGSVDLTGVRRGRDFRWLAYVATGRELGQYGAARRGADAWARTPRGGWAATPPDAVAGASIDVQALETALAPGFRATAEDHGIEVIEGARARHCREAVDGMTFRGAFPQVRWLVGEADLGRWRGQLDYWIFLDGQLGQLRGSVNGDAVAIAPDALQATVEVLMTATERDRDVVIYPPAP